MKTNTFGWVGLIISFLSIFASCKKDDNKSASTGVPSTTTVHHLIGKYVNTSSELYVKDTIYVYRDADMNWFMTCPDDNASASLDTIQFTLNSNDTDFTIPTQYIYGTSVTITGSGSKVLSTQMNLSWTGSVGAVHTNVIYIKQ